MAIDSSAVDNRNGIRCWWKDRVLSGVLSQHPTFTSAKVLLAGIYYEREDIVAMRAILDEVAPQATTDVWVYINQRGLEALSPTTVPGLRETMIAMARNPGFQGNVRETAATIGKRLRYLEPAQFEEFLRVPLTFESATPMPCKYFVLANWLTGQGGRSADVITLLESPQALAAECHGIERNRVFLAQAYLLEAARIAPAPSPANEMLVAKARAVLGEDFSPLVGELVGRPDFATLKPFFGAAVHHDRPDADGNTPLCIAIIPRILRHCSCSSKSARIRCSRAPVSSP